MSDNKSQTTKDALRRDTPWIFRTYAGHSTASASNALFRENMSRGQTGLSIAFDLPTQTGYDPDHPLARGEVGKVGVPVAHLGDMRTLFEDIPLDRMNTSMTINATALWLYALYVALADERGIDRHTLSGTTQNDILKEYLARGAYIFAPDPSMRLTADLIAFAYRETPKWNPVNVCSYHLQEAGATPVQEVAFALAAARTVLSRVRNGGQIDEDDFVHIVGRISFFVNAGVRFITELCKMRAFARLWDEICCEEYGVEDERLRRFRYGVQVNSLGLTEQQPENNVYRILLEMLAVTLSRDARARAVQLPAWNEAIGLPRPWDQQWSLRMQQILAYETDLLEHDDIFNGSLVIEEKVENMMGQIRKTVAEIDAMGGAVAAIENGYMKQQLVMSNQARVAAIEQNDQIVVGVNHFQETAPSPLATGVDSVVTPSRETEEEQIACLNAWRAQRDERKVKEALETLERTGREGGSLMPPSIEAARAGVTTGEWGHVLRLVFGEYRAPTGVGGQGASRAKSAESAAVRLRERVVSLANRLGRRPRLLVGKPGLDGHSNGAEQIALRARDCGMEVIYEGIRLTAVEIVKAALEESVHIVGLSILSGSHLALVHDVMERMEATGIGYVPVVVGGIIPAHDADTLKRYGVAAVYTPRDFQLDTIMADMISIIEKRNLKKENET
ncbi:MAG: protein meaA [Parvularculales bacterium]